LTKLLVNSTVSAVETVSLIDDAATAHIALSPLRRRILTALSEPASATELADRLELTRQRVGYHLKLLEAHGLIRVVEERPKRGFVEHMYQRIGEPAIAPDLAATPDRTATRDAWAAAAAVAAASDVVRAIGTLSAGAAAAGSTLVTATGTAEVTFARPSDLAAFLEEFAALAARYDRGGDAQGARHTVTLISHPTLEKTDDEQ
jgi:DNA-binding transcriptional ArsR family regulator